MRLKLEANELVELCTYDNRRLSIKCTKSANGVPVLDLLPRVRYLLRVSSSPRTRAATRSFLFFSRGLLVVPDESYKPDSRVAVLNMSEKSVRISAGCELAEDEAFDAEPRACEAGFGATLPLLHSAMSPDPPARAQAHSECAAPL